MILLKGFTKIVILLVTLSFLLVVYNYLSKIWREGLENIDSPKKPKSKDHVHNKKHKHEHHSRGLGGDGHHGRGGDGHHGRGGDGHHGRGRGGDSEKINCNKSYTGVTKSGRPSGWNENCIVPPGVTPNEGGFSAYKLCGGRISKKQEDVGHYNTDCRKRWKVTSKGEVSLASPSTHSDYSHSKKSGVEKPRQVKSDTSYRYKKWIPDNLDALHITRKDYEKIGKNFMKAEAKSLGKKMPSDLDSQSEALGKLVWRVYAAEIDQKRAHSPKSHEELLHRETTLFKKVSQIMHSETDYNRSGKCASIIRCAQKMPSNYLSNNYTHGRTSNMYGYKPSQENPVKRKVGYAFAGAPLHGAPFYSHSKSAIAHCAEDRTCGGINYNTETNRYELMPVHAQLIKRKNMVAYIKNHRYRSDNQRYDYSRDHPDDYKKDHSEDSSDEDGDGDKWYNTPYGENEYQRQHREERCRSQDKHDHHKHGHGDHHKHGHGDHHKHGHGDHHKHGHGDHHKHGHGDHHKHGHGLHDRQWDRFGPKSGGYGGGRGGREMLGSSAHKGGAPPWRPRDPNLLPKPYNSLMDLFG